MVVLIRDCGSRFTDHLGHLEARLYGAVNDHVPLVLAVVQGHGHHAYALVHLRAVGLGDVVDILLNVHVHQECFCNLSLNSTS